MHPWHTLQSATNLSSIVWNIQAFSATIDLFYTCSACTHLVLFATYVSIGATLPRKVGVPGCCLFLLHSPFDYRYQWRYAKHERSGDTITTVRVLCIFVRQADHSGHVFQFGARRDRSNKINLNVSKAPPLIPYFSIVCKSISRYYNLNEYISV